MKALGIPSNDITGSGGDDPESVKPLAEDVPLGILGARCDFRDVKSEVPGELGLRHPVEISEDVTCPEMPQASQTHYKPKMKPMKSVARFPRLLVVVAIVVAGHAVAIASTVEGTVRDGNGKPIGGAEVQIEARNRPWAALVKSDARGHYSYDGLTAGVTYRVTLQINGATKAAINNVLAKSGVTQLNFDLKTSSVVGNSVVAKNGKHYVYVPSETGSHLGGRWVEVDENGQANSVNVNNVERAGSEALRRMQSNSGVVGGMGGGH